MLSRRPTRNAPMHRRRLLPWWRCCGNAQSDLRPLPSRRTTPNLTLLPSLRMSRNESSRARSPATGPTIYLDSGRHAGGKQYGLRHLVDMDTDRNALGQAHPCEDGVDAGHALPVRLGIGDVDRTRHTVDMATDDFT